MLKGSGSDSEAGSCAPFSKNDLCAGDATTLYYSTDPRFIPCRSAKPVLDSAKTEATNGVKGEVVKSRFTNRILFNPAKLYACLKFPQRSLEFVDEFSDLLHRVVQMEVILEHFRVFRCVPWVQCQVLTKHANRLADLDAAIMKELGEWPPNVWMGVSVCTPEKGELNKIVTLGRTHAEIKWISFEPWVSDSNMALKDACPNLTGMLRESGIAWNVIGGESGSKEDARLMTLDGNSDGGAGLIAAPSEVPQRV